MAEPRDIFVVCHNIDELGGLQRWAHDISGQFASRGHRVRLVGVTPVREPVDYPAPSTYGRFVLHDAIVAPQWTPRGLAHLNVAGRLRRRRREASVGRAVARLNDLFGSSAPGGIVIVAQARAMQWVGRSDTAGLKIIGMSHESYAASKRSARYKLVKRWYPDVDRFLALTAEDADAWARDGMSNAGSMANPMVMVPTRLPTLAEPVVVTVGRLAHEKGMDMLVEAWALVAQRYPEWRLRIYGSGAEDASLRRLAATLGVADRVELRGHTEDVGAALADASIFALPSRQEGFPLGLLESMAHGLPAVAFDCAPGVRELIADGTSGLLATPGNVVSFATSMERLMADATLRSTLGAEARRSVQRFTPDQIMDRWERMFDLVYA